MNDELGQSQNNAKAVSYNLKVTMKKQGFGTGDNIVDGNKKFLSNTNSVLLDPASASCNSAQKVAEMSDSKKFRRISDKSQDH